MKAMKDNGNKILNDVKEALQEDDNKKFDALCGKLPSRLADVFGEMVMSVENNLGILLKSILDS